MSTIKQRLQQFGLSTADILIPKQGTDLEKWAVVACDQYTSQREYWERVKEHVGQEPSTLKLIFPEVYLNDADKQERIREINRTMHQYVEDNLFTSYADSFFLVHRYTANNRDRWGLMACLDLERYDFSKDSRSLVRATEGTILSRIPPRKEIRRNAPLELPHIMVLISDEKRSVIEPFEQKCQTLDKIYETPLMENGGRIVAYRIFKQEDLKEIADAFSVLYTALDSRNPLLFAMGDGNHSLATAKSCWEDIKGTLSLEQRENHPARYALVELENIYDSGLVFEPIHRLLFHSDYAQFLKIVRKNAQKVTIEEIPNLRELSQRINGKGKQKFGYLDKEGYKLFTLDKPSSSIAAGTLQLVIDELVENRKCEVDYVHGIDVVDTQGKLEDNCGLILPAVSKDTFFDTIIKDKALPRKTFSMGEAAEKRFYMEARKIQ